MKTAFYRIVILIFLVCSGYAHRAQNSPETTISHFSLPAGAEYLPGRIIFKLNSSNSDQAPMQVASLAHRLSGLGVNEIKPVFRLKPTSKKRNGLPDIGGIYEAFFPLNTDVEFAANELLASYAIEYAEPRYIYKSLYLPNDVYADTTLPTDFMYHLGAIQAYEAWDLNKGDTSIVIGISDSGISFDHIDLKKNLSKNTADPIDGVDNDGDGYTDNYRGWDFGGVLGKQGDNDPSVPCGVDECVHGMPVAGLAAADTDNRRGVSGVGFNCRFLPLKASPDSLPDGITHGYESILYAAQQGAQIVNCSWGGQVNSKVGADLVKYVNLRYQTGIIAACGNTPRDLMFYPASYPEVLSVSNVHQGDSICCPTFLSSTHNYAVDVAAPGWELYSTVNLTDYGPFSGTSASAPVVAGAAGIVMSHFPDYTGFQAGQRLRVTTDDIYQNPYNQPYFEKLGTGRINLYRALTDQRKPSIRLSEYAFFPDPDQQGALPGDSLYIPATFVNYLDPSSQDLEISLEVLGNAANFVDVPNPAWRAGVMQENELKSPSRSFTLFIKANAPENLVLNLRFRYHDPSLNYDDFEHISLTINPTYVDVKQNNLVTSINSRGNIGFPVRVFEKPGLGIQHLPSEQSAIGDAGFMFTSGGKLADNISGALGNRTANWLRTETIRRKVHPLAPFYASGVMNDLVGLNASVKQEVFAWSDQQFEEIIILRYRIYNQSTSAISDGYAGILADWEIFEPSINAADFDGGNEIVYAWDRLNMDKTRYGISLIDGGRYRAFASKKIDFSFNTNSKIGALQTPPSTVNSRVGTGGSPADVVQAIAAGPLSIPAGDSLDVVFALIAGEDLGDLRQKASRARNRYDCYLNGQGPDMGFLAPSGAVLVGSSVQFQDLNASTSQWAWDFGDGNFSNQKNPSHSFQQPGNYRVRMTVAEGNCTVTQEQLVLVRRAVRVEEEMNALGLVVSPNPASEFVEIRWEVKPGLNSKIELFNALGQRVFSNSFSGNDMRISVSHLPKGVYILCVKHGDRLSSHKVIVSR